MGTQVRYVFFTHLAVVRNTCLRTDHLPGSLRSDMCNRPVYCQRNWNSYAVDLRSVQSYEMEAFLFIYFYYITSRTNRQRTVWPHASSSVHDQRNQQVPAVTHTNIDFIQMRLAQEKPPIGQWLSKRKFHKQRQKPQTLSTRRLCCCSLACMSLVNLTPPPLFFLVCAPHEGRSTDRCLSWSPTKCIVFSFPMQF